MICSLLYYFVCSIRNVKVVKSREESSMWMRKFIMKGHSILSMYIDNNELKLFDHGNIFKQFHYFLVVFYLQLKEK